MRFSLNDGELHTLDLENPDNYRKLDFKNQVINVSGTGSELVRTDSDYRTDREMDIAEMSSHVAQAFNAALPLRERISEYMQKKFKYLFSDSFVYNMKDSIDDRRALSLALSDVNFD